MKNLLNRSLVLALAVSLLSGCSSSDSEPEDSGDTGGGNYMVCVLEYKEAVRAGVLNATTQEIIDECLSQYPYRP